MAVPPPSPPSILPPSDKQALRRRLRAARAAHVAGLRAAGALGGATTAAAERLLDHIPEGACVALYSAFGEEIDPITLAHLLDARGQRLALPYVEPDRVTMRFIAWKPGDSLATGTFGLSQPDASAAESIPDVIVTPLVGFDRQGARIGQGAGFYDRAFAALPDARRFGLAWSVQESVAIPTDPWDVPLHAVGTELDWIVCEGTES